MWGFFSSQFYNLPLISVLCNRNDPKIPAKMTNLKTWAVNAIEHRILLWFHPIPSLSHHAVVFFCNTCSHTECVKNSITKPNRCVLRDGRSSGLRPFATADDRKFDQLVTSGNGYTATVRKRYTAYHFNTRLQSAACTGVEHATLWMTECLIALTYFYRNSVGERASSAILCVTRTNERNLV